MFSSRRNFSLVALYSLKFTRCSLLIRRGYSISKRLVRLNRFKSFPLQLSGHQDITSVIICACCVINFNTLWLGVHQCKISWKLHPSGKAQYLKYYLQSLLQKIKKSAAGETRPILTNTRSSRPVNFAVNLARFFRTPMLYYIDNHIQNR